ncbi:MAG: hypothetical protein SFZ24_12160 [Planctomycetota bacterium]|nr:hypothetical protein [Planctomycetota bacterium]
MQQRRTGEHSAHRLDLGHASQPAVREATRWLRDLRSDVRGMLSDFRRQHAEMADARSLAILDEISEWAEGLRCEVAELLPRFSAARREVHEQGAARRRAEKGDISAWVAGLRDDTHATLRAHARAAEARRAQMSREADAFRAALGEWRSEFAESQENAARDRRAAQDAAREDGTRLRREFVEALRSDVASMLDAMRHADRPRTQKPSSGGVVARRAPSSADARRDAYLSQLRAAASSARTIVSQAGGNSAPAAERTSTPERAGSGPRTARSRRPGA